MDDLETNPSSMPGAPPPRIHLAAVNGTTLYVEVRGEGTPLLIIPGGAEDAEGWRPVAERLVGHTVVTYDRRGTLRSGREDWPGRGATQHADDAAALLAALELKDPIVLGGSSAGVIAVELAIRHPGSAARVLAYEPGFLRSVPAGLEIQAAIMETLEAYLVRHPDDWDGAYVEFARAMAPGPGLGSTGYLADPQAHEWYARREAANAEPFVRDDVPLLTTGLADAPALASTPAEVRFSYGSQSGPLFREIATRLASVRGQEPDVIKGAGHALYLAPELAAAYVHEHAHPSAG